MIVNPNEKEGVFFEFKYRANYTGQPQYESVVKTSAETLPDILSDFEQFLRGAGFSFEGEVDIINEEA